MSEAYVKAVREDIVVPIVRILKEIDQNPRSEYRNQQIATLKAKDGTLSVLFSDVDLVIGPYISKSTKLFIRKGSHEFRYHDYDVWLREPASEELE
jgi:hypothetical protein